MLEDSRIGVIGAGNMGGGLIAGWVSHGGIPAVQIAATDPIAAALEPLAALGVKTTDNLAATVDGCDLVVVAVKPQTAPQLMGALAPLLTTDQLLISIMAGVTTAAIEQSLGTAVPVVRAMPQMLARLGVAASAVCAGQTATPEHLEAARALFALVGTAVAVPEAQMDAVTGLAGSGPAYVYAIIEALTDGGVRVGLTRETAAQLAAQTVAGAGRMALESELHPAQLRGQVTSPGGTTIAGLHMLEEKGLRDALMSAVKAATERSVELGSQ